MSMNLLRAARLPASAALLCLLLGNASAFAAAAAPGAGHAPAAAASTGGNGAPVTTDAFVIPNDTNRPPHWRRTDGQKAHNACPLFFPVCWQDAVE
jgi:hypothetical protein